MTIDELKSDQILNGPLFPEPVQVLLATPVGAGRVKMIGRGLNSSQVYDHILSAADLTALSIAHKHGFDGDASRFALGIEAMRLGLAYEYDPYFALSIARVDPLPHQLEAVYDYFLRMPRIRFLLADDPGAGKTIMAGLLVKELKIRGLIKRILIVTPANLTFQWQRELRDKFREGFEVIRGDVLRANYGTNPWQERNQVITSVSWVSTVVDARDSLLRSNWDLIIVDEAHKMSAASTDHKTLAYQLGEKLSEMTDHFLLMTATPHKGDPEHFRLFLSLLDRDVYGDIRSLEKAIEEQAAPFYLRRTKEALVSFPDPETGKPHLLFTRRNVDTIDFPLTLDELEFYDKLTEYVEDQSRRASEDDSARGRAIGFTMAMLQRRFASSVYAVRRSLERMKEKREKILRDPEGYRRQQIEARLPLDFDDLPEDEQTAIEEQLEGVVVSYDPIVLRDEIIKLERLIVQAVQLEARESESKLSKLKEVLAQRGLLSDPAMKLLIFTEHKDTLDYLVKKLREWDLSVTQIHGGMKIGDRDMPGTRIWAEREFRENCRVLVATEAAGEGINLQFCWLMINYDIPWNPVRLEQRMGRIHRYGQDRDCFIFNFVSSRTREGRVLHKLFERLKKIEKDLDPRATGKVFNVLGDVLPAKDLERMIRDMYAHNTTVDDITRRIVEDVDVEHFRRITNHTLEALARKELNLSAIVGKAAEARERRLVPEVIHDFFLAAGPMSGVHPRPPVRGRKIYRIGKLPRPLISIGDRLEPRFGRLGKEYRSIAFDKNLLRDDPTLEWVTPGHPLFEAVRQDVLDQTRTDLLRGAVFYDLQSEKPRRLDVFTAAVKDGRGNRIHQRLFIVQTGDDGQLSLRQPTIFLDVQAAKGPLHVPSLEAMPGLASLEIFLLENALQTFLEEIRVERLREINTVRNHLSISLNAIIDRVQVQFAELWQQKEAGSKEPGIDGRLSQCEDRLTELNDRLERRLAELSQEGQLTVSDVHHVGTAWVLPHPERTAPDIKPMVSDPEVEKIAVEVAIRYEISQGREVQSVEDEDRGFDLISRRPHAEDPQSALEVRFIEVKGRKGVAPVSLTPNEYKKAEQLREDYWLYVVYGCDAEPALHLVRDPARLGWEPYVKVDHYLAKADDILSAGECVEVCAAAQASEGDKQ